MAKPLFRFTVGPCLKQGLEILAESIARTTQSLGLHNWDWVICYNGLNKQDLEYINSAIAGRPIQLFAQNWANCPINDNCQSPRRRDGSFEANGTRCGGTLWKVCPARLRMETHEIVMDNDVIVLKQFPQIKEWLDQTEKSLILEEPIRFYGKYDSLFPAGDEGPFLNSGFMGFPPGYDFGSAIAEVWKQYGSNMNLTQADEQGLLTYTLSRLSSIRVNKSQVYEFLARDYNGQITGSEQAIHFTQANRLGNHAGWKQYQKICNETMVM